MAAQKLKLTSSGLECRAVERFKWKFHKSVAKTSFSRGSVRLQISRQVAIRCSHRVLVVFGILRVSRGVQYERSRLTIKIFFHLIYYPLRGVITCCLLKSRR